MSARTRCDHRKVTITGDETRDPKAVKDDGAKSTDRMVGRKIANIPGEHLENSTMSLTSVNSSGEGGCDIARRYGVAHLPLC